MMIELVLIFIGVIYLIGAFLSLVVLVTLAPRPQSVFGWDSWWRDVIFCVVIWPLVIMVVWCKRKLKLLEDTLPESPCPASPQSAGLERLWKELEDD